MLFFSKRYNILTKWVLLLVVPTTLLLLVFRPVSALDMTNRTIIVSSGVPGAVVTNDYSFDFPSTNVVGSLVFEYCDNSPLVTTVCNAPSGLNVSAAILVGQTLNTGFTVDGVNTTNNAIVLTRAAAAGIVGSSTYAFANITNPSASNQTIFVRITSHASADGSGPLIDHGTVAFSTTVSAFSVGVYVPPYLTFCTGITVAIDCSSTVGSLVSFGELDTNNASTATTQMSAATNDFSGYNIFVSGSTLTSGNNVVAALATQSGSTPGNAQFGLNLRSNTNPPVGADPGGIGTGVPNPSYNTQNLFRFNSGDIVAASTLSTEFTRYTASYIANVPFGQAPGLYATTITYTAVATF